jgi:hypothetical protein
VTVVADLIAVLQPKIAAHRDSAPVTAELPYAVVGAAPLPETPALRGDGRHTTTQLPQQIDVYQSRAAEDDTLVPAIINLLDGVVLESSHRVCQFEYKLRAPLLPEEGNIVRDAITVRLMGRG